MTNGAIINEITRFAPPSLQEEWDNTGLQVGRLSDECTGVYICLDVTPEAVDAAVKAGANLIVAHHPLFFRGVKRLTGADRVQQAAMKAIAAGVSVYSSHTAADSTLGGVSYLLAERLGIEPLRTLSPMKGRLVKLQVIVPRSHADEVRLALFDIGCGAVGGYDCCPFSVEGDGSFRALDGANPFLGEIGQLHSEPETAIEMVLPAELMGKARDTIAQVHPYECPAYSFTAMLNETPDLGLGIYGTLDTPMTAPEFAALVKERLGVEAVTTSVYPGDIQIRRVAVCGGSGGEFIQAAKAAGAQAYVTGDIRYHDFVDNVDEIFLVDAGHYHTEAPVKEAFASAIRTRFPEVAVTVADDDCPVRII